MSDRTQEQGRTFYTERDFAFSPTNESDIIRTNVEWLRDLIYATRVGDPTFDPLAKQAILNPVAPPVTPPAG